MKIFVISDNHFDALPYMQHVFPRPEFRDNDHMNTEMIRRWNAIVSKEDLVIMVGDTCYTDPRPWLEQLNGSKVMIRGNHDEWCEGYAGDYSMTLEYRGVWFYITHDPAYVPRDWTGWCIHGHHHNMPQFPQFDRVKKNVNVACEMVEYTPVSLDSVVDKISSSKSFLSRIAQIVCRFSE